MTSCLKNSPSETDFEDIPDSSIELIKDAGENAKKVRENFKENVKLSAEFLKEGNEDIE